ncbi:MAG: hypothetical protein JWN17_263 [Frankiales bacterium]|nr:hypothetical protein [Frankiales bacterium]
MVGLPSRRRPSTSRRSGRRAPGSGPCRSPADQGCWLARSAARTQRRSPGMPAPGAGRGRGVPARVRELRAEAVVPTGGGGGRPVGRDRHDHRSVLRRQQVHDAFLEDLARQQRCRLRVPQPGIAARRRPVSRARTVVARLYRGARRRPPPRLGRPVPAAAVQQVVDQGADRSVGARSSAAVARAATARSGCSADQTWSSSSSWSPADVVTFRGRPLVTTSSGVPS